MERGAGLAFVLSLLVTLLMALPVVMAPGERIFGDGLILSRADPNRDPLVVIDQFRAGRVPAPYLQPLTDLPGRFLARVFGPVIAYNLVVLATFPLAAATAYLLGRHLLGSHIGALIASLAYAFMPFHVMQAGGHPHIAQTQWLPLYFLALSRCIESPTAVRAGLLVLSAAAAALADFYAGFIVAVLTPVAILVFGLGSPKPLPSAAGRWRGMAVATLVLTGAGVIGVAAMRLLLSDVMAKAGVMAFPRTDLFSWNAKWWSYLVPPADHPRWGAPVRDFWAERGVGADLLEHQQVSLALSLVLLALVALWRSSRDPSARAGARIAPALALLGVAALFCSLSPERTIGSFTFTRPAALLYEQAPMFRAYARFGVVVGLAASLLAGLGAGLLWQARWRGRVAAIGLLTLAFVEYGLFSPRGSRDVLPTRAHRWLAGLPGPAKVLDCVEPARFTDTLALPLLGQEVSFLGASGLDDCGEAGLGEKLAAMGFTHAIVRRDSPEGRWRMEAPSRFAAHTALRPEVDLDDAAVLAAATSTPGAAYIHEWSGFGPREYEGASTWRWMGEAAALRLRAPPSPRIRLHLELRSFPGKRWIEWSIDGGQRGEWMVTPEWRVHTLALGPRQPGDFTLTLRARDPAVVAHEVLGNRDTRALAVALKGWRFESVED